MIHLRGHHHGPCSSLELSKGSASAARAARELAEAGSRSARVRPLGEASGERVTERCTRAEVVRPPLAALPPHSRVRQ